MSIKRNFSSVVSIGNRRIRAGAVGDGVVAKGVPTGLVVASRSKGLTALIGSALGDWEDAALDLNDCDCGRKLGAAMVDLMAAVVAGENGVARLDADDDDDDDKVERNGGLTGGFVVGFETMVEERPGSAFMLASTCVLDTLKGVGRLRV
jgi:hypothetical protein